MRKFTLLCLGLLLACVGVKAQTQVNRYDLTGNGSGTGGALGQDPITLTTPMLASEDWMFVGTYTITGNYLYNQWGTSLAATADLNGGSYGTGFRLHINNQKQFNVYVDGTQKLFTNTPTDNFRVKMRHYASDKKVVVTLYSMNEDVETEVESQEFTSVANFDNVTELHYGLNSGTTAKVYFEYLSITYKYNYTFVLEDGTTHEKTFELHQSKLALPIESNGTYLTVEEPELVSGTEYNVKATRKYPFEFSKQTNGTVDAGATWYTMIIRGDNAVYNTESGQPYCQNALQVNSGYIWCFVPAASDDYLGVKVCNLLDGRYLKVNDGLADKSAVTCDATFEEAASFLPQKNGDGFNLVLASHPNILIGDHHNGWKDGEQLVIWVGGDDGDPGNRFLISPIDEEFMRFDLADNQYVGGNAPTALVAKQDAYNANKTMVNLSEYVDAYAENEEAFTEVTLNENGYYRIVSASNVALTSAGTWSNNATGDFGDPGDDGRRVTHEANSASSLSALWKYEAVDETKGKLRNINTGLLLGQAGESRVNLLTTGAESGGWYSIWEKKETTEPTVWNLYQTNATNGYLTALSTNNNVGVSSDATADAAKWRLQPVTSVPVTLDEEGWASLVLPYAVEVPSDVTVYYAKSATTNANNELVLTAWETSVIPANTPVFLNGAAGEKYMTITSDDAATAMEGENLLTGATFRRQTSADAGWGVYGLKKNAGKLAKAASTLKVLPANRAFIALTSAQSEVRFAFGELTGVEEIPAAALQAEKVYYDLSGRRVWAPKNGIFVTASGEKVFIK